MQHSKISLIQQMYPDLDADEARLFAPISMAWFMADPVDAANEVDVLRQVFELPNAEHIYRTEIAARPDCPHRVEAGGDFLLNLPADKRRPLLRLLSGTHESRVRCQFAEQKWR